MLSTKKDQTVIKFSENSLELILKTHDLNIAVLSECVKLLRNWIEKQNHFNKKDFSQNFLEATVISCKGSVERAKSRLDKYCTLRTMMPRLFDKVDARRDFQDMHRSTKVAILPQCTDDFYRVFIVKLTNDNLSLSIALDFYRYGALCLEYLKAHDHFNGAIVLLDYRDVSIKDIIPIINPVDLGDAIKLYVNGYGMRIKGIHFLTSSKLIETVAAILKSLMSPKIGSRIKVHSTVESLYDAVPRDILPVEYGGQEKSFYNIYEDCLNMLSAEDNVAYLREMKNAHTNESFRPEIDFNDQHMDIQGTFRSLSFD